MKKLSVIIPAHNGALYIGQAIQSVLAQTYPHLEIWAIDNGSKDNTKEIIRSFPMVNYVHSEVADTAAARNEGLKRAKGEWIAFLDQDDIWEPTKLQKQLDYLANHPSLSGAICQQKMVLQEGHTKPHWLKKEFLETIQSAYLPSALLVKRSVMEKMNFFDTAFSLTSDVAWFLKAKHSGIEIGLLEEPLLIRRIHSDNASNRCSQIQKEILSAIQLSLAERRKKISIIMPVFNGEKYLREAVESALLQDYPQKEIIVVNDGSTDSTQTIIDSFGSSVRPLYQSNGGLGSARNTGIKASTGQYLAFLDHDDLWEKNKLSLQMAKMDATDPLVFSYVKQFLCPTLSTEEKTKLNVNEEILPSHFAGNLLLSKKRFLEIGYFFEKKTVGEFVDWYLRALEAKVPMVMLPELTLRRRIHGSNMGRQKELYERAEYLKILKNSLDRRRSHATSP
jgi:glycosyltransferase involved in cell wall biosynthesis